MNHERDVTARPWSLFRRAVSGGLVILFSLIVLLFMGAIPLVSSVAIPLFRMTPSDWVLTAGKMCGILAATLVLLQYALSGRIDVLDRIFALNRLLLLHRGVAVTAVVLGTLHPLLMFAAPGRDLHFPHLDHWPQYLGPLLLIGLWTTVIVSLYRTFLAVRFDTWWRMHRLGVFSAVALLALHALFAGSDFATGWPRSVLLGFLGLYALFFLWKKVVQPVRMRKNPFRVVNVSHTGRDVNVIELEGPMFPYAPGQFSFIRFLSPNVDSEEHHFTLSSTPTRPESIIHTVKCVGDFTARLGSLRPGDQAVLDGPYGLFTHLAHTGPDEEIVMIAGGIGITPILSMLRYMADRESGRPVTLIWSNRKREDLILHNEFENLRRDLPNLKLHAVFTREEGSGVDTGRLDRQKLEQFLDGVSRRAHVYLCGPPPMMGDVEAHLTHLGWGRRRIHTEKFAL